VNGDRRLAALWTQELQLKATSEINKQQVKSTSDNISDITNIVEFKVYCCANCRGVYYHRDGAFHGTELFPNNIHGHIINLVQFLSDRNMN
jgi:hypothetical protein